MLGGDVVGVSQCMLECFLAAFAARRCDGVELVASVWPQTVPDTVLLGCPGLYAAPDLLRTPYSGVVPCD